MLQEQSRGPLVRANIDLPAVPTLAEVHHHARDRLAQTPSLDDIAIRARERLLDSRAAAGSSIRRAAAVILSRSALLSLNFGIVVPSPTIRCQAVSFGVDSRLQLHSRISPSCRATRQSCFLR